jgi:hypothetical protein
MKSLSYIAVLAPELSLACCGAIAAGEMFFQQPIVNCWEKVDFPVKSELRPLAQKLALLGENPPSRPLELRALDDLRPPETPPKDTTPHERYAAINDTRVEVRRGDGVENITTRRRPRLAYSLAATKSFPRALATGARV